VKGHITLQKGPNLLSRFVLILISCLPACVCIFWLYIHVLLSERFSLYHFLSHISEALLFDFRTIGPVIGIIDFLSVRPQDCIDSVYVFDARMRETLFCPNVCAGKEAGLSISIRRLDAALTSFGI